MGVDKRVLAVAAMMCAGFACKSSTSTSLPKDSGAETRDVGPDITAVICVPDDRINGEACSCASQCGSGFCADGFCCESACGGTCQSCGLPSSLGKCTQSPAGGKPRLASDCKVEDKATCGLDGTCDGAGKCRTYLEGTVCRPGTCEADAVVGTYTCDGARGCKLGATTVCAPFSCDLATNQCFPKCSSDANCVSGRKCVDASCGLKMNGAACERDGECASTHCADGVCCNTACDGECRSCSLVGQMGSCQPTAAGLGHVACAQQATATCGTTGLCDGFGSCATYPANSPCGTSTCSGATAMNSARTCDGIGTCQESEVRDCGTYRCANGKCNSRCTTSADCAEGVVCVNGNCGPRVDGQPCAANADCLNLHCVRDTPTGPGICCNTDCAGACRSCSVAGTFGRCTPTTAGAADPRRVCTDMTAATCGTDGRCDGAGGCRLYAPGTVCAAETCVTDVYTGPSTCNASGQCLKPPANPCFPYHCNANRCFSSCTTSAQCAPPSICGMNGVISSCGLKPLAAPCSAASECSSNFCAQGVCCNSACNTACRACNLAGTTGTCSNVSSGADPQRLCAVQAQSTCGTTGQCAAGQCARWASGTQCRAPSCMSASTRIPQGTCNGAGVCSAPANTSCAPGRCDATTLTCNSTCTTDAQCTAPARCLNGSCGLQPAAGPCTANNQCQAGLSCYLSEGSPGVCCDSACTGTCESCRLSGAVGVCTAVSAGAVDPDPASVCVAAANPSTCGLDGRCSGNNTAANAAGTARCRFLGTGQGCRNQSCVDSTLAGVVSTLTAAASCTGTGACGAVVTGSCGAFKCLNATQCATSCTSNANCVGVVCNLQTHRCGERLPNGSLCVAGSDCTSGFCPDGRCCGTACAGACQTCNNTTGTCGAVANGTADSLCGAAAPPCGRTGLCEGGACANTANGTTCSDGNACNGVETCQTGTCSPGTAVTCRAADQCHVAGVCAPATGLCTNPNAANGTVCNDGTMCTRTDTCQAGACTGASPVVCPAAGPCRGAGTCAPATGLCTAGTPVANGTACNDGNMCTGTDSCQAGACTGSNPVVCPAAGPCRGAGTCVPATGLCAAGTPVANGTTCDDNIACTRNDMCQAGACTGIPVVCTASDECHLPGTCNPTDGTCSSGANAPSTTACGEGPSCTAGALKPQDRCSAGACVPGQPAACPGGAACATAMSCSPPPPPTCTTLQDCGAGPAVCVCPSGTTCGAVVSGMCGIAIVPDPPLP